MMRWIDIQGHTYGRLTAILKTCQRRYGSVVWECHCSCGQTVFVEASKLRGGNVRSCGCLKRDCAAMVGSQYGARNAYRLKQKSGTQLKHIKAGGTNRAKALLARNFSDGIAKRIKVIE